MRQAQQLVDLDKDSLRGRQDLAQQRFHIGHGDREGSVHALNQLTKVTSKLGEWVINVTEDHKRYNKGATQPTYSFMCILVKNWSMALLKSSVQATCPNKM